MKTQWYAASLVLYFKYKEGPQRDFLVWENTVIIEAGDEAEGLRKAIERGKSEEGDSQGSLTLNKRPATLVFAGVRKLLKCDDPQSRPGDGSEISYSEFEVHGQESLKRLAEGKEVKLTYIM